MTKYPEIILQLVDRGIITQTEADNGLAFCVEQSGLMVQGKISPGECQRRIAEHAQRQAHVYLRRMGLLPSGETTEEALTDILQNRVRREA